MKKILLIGELNDVIRSINEGLSGQYQVQVCSAEIEMIRSMMKVIKPNMLIFCQIGDIEVDRAFFEWMKSTCEYIPVLVITTESEWKKTGMDFSGYRLRTLFRPVSTTVIKETCQNMMNAQKSKEGGGEQEDSESTASKKKRVMIVDDSPLILRNIKAFLQSEYDVFVAPSGEQALKLIPQRQPDVVLLDYEMSGMNGKETFEAMLSDAYMASIPVIFLTSVTDRNKVYGVLQSRPAGYILKPVDQNNLLEEIAKVLN